VHWWTKSNFLLFLTTGSGHKSYSTQNCVTVIMVCSYTCPDCMTHSCHADSMPDTSYSVGQWHRTSSKSISQPTQYNGLHDCWTTLCRAQCSPECPQASCPNSSRSPQAEQVGCVHQRSYEQPGHPFSCGEAKFKHPVFCMLIMSVAFYNCDLHTYSVGFTDKHDTTCISVLYFADTPPY